MQCAENGWRRLLLALTLCLFAFGYAAPTSLPALATMPRAAMGSDCPGASGHHTGAAKTEGLGGASPCCVAHCLPAVAEASPAGAILRAEHAVDPTAPDETGEGRAVPVPLPPPRG